MEWDLQKFDKGIVMKTSIIPVGKCKAGCEGAISKWDPCCSNCAVTPTSCNLSRHSGHFTFGLLVRKTTRRDMHTYLFELWEYNWYFLHHVMPLKRVLRKPLDLAKYNSPVEPLLSGPWERPKCWSLLDPRSSWALIWAKYGSLVLYSPLFSPQMCALPQRSHD